MRGKMMYSCYDRKTDMPIVVYGTAEEIGKVIGMSANTVKSVVCRQFSGMRNHKKYEFFKDGPAPEEYSKKPALKHSDTEAILAYYECGNATGAAKKLGRDRTGIYYVMDKAYRITGLDPRNPVELKKLVAMLKEGAEDGK